MTSAKSGFPSLYLYNRVYFRIAGKTHSVTYPSDLVDNQSVLTAMHLVNPRNEMSNGFVLPIDTNKLRKKECSSQICIYNVLLPHRFRSI
jgi:hypothetical protein